MPLHSNTTKFCRQSKYLFQEWTRKQNHFKWEKAEEEQEQIDDEYCQSFSHRMECMVEDELSSTFTPEEERAWDEVWSRYVVDYDGNYKRLVQIANENGYPYIRYNDISQMEILVNLAYKNKMRLEDYLVAMKDNLPSISI